MYATQNWTSMLLTFMHIHHNIENILSRSSVLLCVKVQEQSVFSTSCGKCPTLGVNTLYPSSTQEQSFDNAMRGSHVCYPELDIHAFDLHAHTQGIMPCSRECNVKDIKVFKLESASLYTLVRLEEASRSNMYATQYWTSMLLTFMYNIENILSRSSVVLCINQQANPTVNKTSFAFHTNTYS